MQAEGESARSTSDKSLWPIGLCESWSMRIPRVVTTVNGTWTADSECAAGGMLAALQHWAATIHSTGLYTRYIVIADHTTELLFEAIVSLSRRQFVHVSFPCSSTSAVRLGCGVNVSWETPSWDSYWHVATDLYVSTLTLEFLYFVTRPANTYTFSTRWLRMLCTLLVEWYHLTSPPGLYWGRSKIALRDCSTRCPHIRVYPLKCRRCDAIFSSVLS